MEKPLMQGPFYNENREITVYCIFGGNLGQKKNQNESY
jgi:hypothetical protein